MGIARRGAWGGDDGVGFRLVRSIVDDGVECGLLREELGWRRCLLRDL